MKAVLYRGDASKYLFVKSALSFVMYEVSVLLEADEAVELGIMARDIRSMIWTEGAYYKTDNDKVVNLIRLTDSKAYFAQFSLDVVKPTKDRIVADTGALNYHNMRKLLGEKVTPEKLRFFVMAMFPNSPYFGKPKDVAAIIFKQELLSRNVKKKYINDEYIQLVFDSLWIKNIKSTPMGRFVMSSLKQTLSECGVDYKAVVSNYKRIAEYGDDMKACLMANKELERLVVQAENEEKKLMQRGEHVNFEEIDGTMEVNKRLPSGTEEEEDSMENAIMEAGEELEELGVDYINQGLDDVESSD